MPVTPTDYIWMDGDLVKWEDAKIHILAHAMHYGSSVFEGMRVYKTPKGPAAFRLREHTQRLFNSAKLYYMEIPFTPMEINDAIMNLVRINDLEECYVRPLAYRGYGDVGVDPTGIPISVAIAVWPWGKYLGEGALEKGVSVCFSSWNRMAPNTLPAMAKAGANYMNSQLMKLEAKRQGYVEAIALDTNGLVSEGSGENIFVIHNERIITPTFGASILPGITRDTIMTLAREMGYRVIEQDIPREMVYLADEVFFTGTAAEVTPISCVDDHVIGTGVAGPITRRLQQAFFDILQGNTDDTHGWLTPVAEYKPMATV